MSNTIRGGRSIDLNVQAGESLKVSTLTGTYTATVLAGAGAGTALATESSGGATYGPYAAGVVIRVKCSADGLVDIDVGTAPALGYYPNALFATNDNGDVTGLVDGDGYSYGVELAPVLPTTEAIRAVAYRVQALGGGRVVMPVGDIALTGPLPVLSGVTYVGRGYRLTADNNYYVTTGGTRLLGDGTFPCFTLFSGSTPTGGGISGGSTATATLGDLVEPLSTVDLMNVGRVNNAGIENLAIDTFSFGIKIGAKFNSGMINSKVRNVWIANCTEWAAWFENCGNGCIFDELTPAFSTNGAMWVSSGAALMIHGDYQIRNIRPWQNTKYGCCIASRGGSSINNVHMQEIGGNGIASSYSVAISGMSANYVGTANTIAAQTGMTGYIVGTLLTITNVNSGAVYPGMNVTATAGGTAVPGLYIESQVSGTTGSTGTYRVNAQGDLGSSGAPATLTIGGLLTGSAALFTLDQQLAGTGVSTAPPVYIVGGAGSTWYVNTYTATASTNITGRFTTFTVPDLSKFGVGMPISFVSGNNGFTTNRIYFVRSMSAATGSGTMTLGETVGALAGIGFTAANALTIYTAGYPYLFVGNLDPKSIVQGVDIRGNCDFELSGTSRAVFQGIRYSGHFDLGMLSISPYSIASITVRNVSPGVVFHNKYNSLVADLDVNTIGMTGITPSAVMALHNGVGFQRDNSTGQGKVFLSGASTPEIAYTNSMTTFAGKSTAMATTSFAASGNIALDCNHVTFTGASGQTLTLPTAASTNTGVWYEISNPTANSVTISAGALNIVGAGTSGTSITLATLTSVRLRSAYNGTNYYWSRL